MIGFQILSTSWTLSYAVPRRASIQSAMIDYGSSLYGPEPAFSASSGEGEDVIISCWANY